MGWAVADKAATPVLLLVPHERYLVPLRTLEPKTAASLTDAALTPYRAITRALPFVPPDYPALVIGCGALGQFGVKILRLLSGADIIAVDLDDSKLTTARQAGATHAINARDPDRRGRSWTSRAGSGSQRRSISSVRRVRSRWRSVHAASRSRGSSRPRRRHRAPDGTQDGEA